MKHRLIKLKRSPVAWVIAALTFLGACDKSDCHPSTATGDKAAVVQGKVYINASFKDSLHFIRLQAMQGGSARYGSPLSWQLQGDTCVSSFTMSCRMSGMPYRVYCYIDRNMNGNLDNGETCTCGNTPGRCTEVYPPQTLTLVFP